MRPSRAVTKIVLVSSSMTQEIAVETHVFGSRGEPRALLQPVPFLHNRIVLLRPLAAFLAGDQGPTAMGLINLQLSGTSLVSLKTLR